MSGPPPPADLASRKPHLLHLKAGTVFHRFYTKADGARIFDPIFFDGSRQGRFNSPDGSYGALYVAKTASGAFAETFLRTSGRRAIDSGFLSRKAYVRLAARRRLAFIKFDGRWLARLGATAAVLHGDPPYENAQAWSNALRSHPVGADGVAYTSRHDPSEICYVLFSNSDPPVSELSRDTALDVDWFWRLAERYQVGLAP